MVGVRRSCIKSLLPRRKPNSVSPSDSTYRPNHAAASLPPRADLLKSVVYAMSPRAVSDVWVHGRQVVASGRLTTVDQRELLARVGELTKGWSISTAAR